MDCVCAVPETQSKLLQGNVIFDGTAHKYRKIDVKKSQPIILDNILLSIPVIILLCMLALIKTDLALQYRV